MEPQHGTKTCSCSFCVSFYFPIFLSQEDRIGNENSVVRAARARFSEGRCFQILVIHLSSVVDSFILTRWGSARRYVV